MRTLRILPVALAGALVVTLAACDPGGGSPTPSSEPTSAPTVVATPTEEAPRVAERVVVTSAGLTVVGTGGSTLVAVDFEADVASVAARLAEALDIEPTVTTSTGTGGGCDADQTMYDFGGLLLRAPGWIGATGAFEAVVSTAGSSTGIPYETVAGLQVGIPRAAFDAAVGDEVLIGDYPPDSFVGFDVLNPGDAEFDHIGAIAHFESGTLVKVTAPHLIYADC